MLDYCSNSTPQDQGLLKKAAGADSNHFEDYINPVKLQPDDDLEYLDEQMSTFCRQSEEDRLIKFNYTR